MTDLAQAEHTQAPTAADEFADVLDDLRQLSTSMLLAFRLAAGQRLLERFYAGDIARYRSQDARKDDGFLRFAQACRQELADIGLSASLARQSIVAHITWQQLPPAVRVQLRLSHVVELGRVGDSTARARLAMDTALQQWNVGQLKAAIEQHAAGRYYDTDPQTPGTQPPPAKAPPEHRQQTGRLVTQLHKASEGLGQWQAAWRSGDARVLHGEQRVKLAAALQALKAKVAELEGELGEVEG